MKPSKHFVAGIITILCSTAVRAEATKVIAYYPEWGARYNHYFAKDIEKRGAADKLSVLNYAFAEPGPDSSGTIVPQFLNTYEAYQRVYNSPLSVDGVADDSTQPLRGQFNQLKKLKARHPNLKILISIGGWDGCKYFSDAMATSESREKFVEAIIDRFVRGNLPIHNGAGGKRVAEGIFDGVDIDWEYPIGGGLPDNHYDAHDNDHLTAFYSLLRMKLDLINPKLLITAAVPVSMHNARHYNIQQDQRYLDWYNLMTYDFVGEWDKSTNHHTNLLTSPRDTSPDPQSFDKAIRLFIDSFRVSPGKIVPGAAFFGHGWTNVEMTNHGLYQSGTGIEPSDSEANSRDYSFWSSLLRRGYEYYWDTLAMAPTLYSETNQSFWTYDDAKSIALKSRYVDAYHLGGIMCWEISGDDSSGTLINAMYSGEMPSENVKETHAGKVFPSIELSLLENEDQLAAGTNIVLDTKVVGHNSPIAKVEFFVDGKSIGYDAEAPFDWVWFNAGQGKHTIKAVATDHDGYSKISNPIGIMVKSSPKEQASKDVGDWK